MNAVPHNLWIWIILASCNSLKNQVEVCCLSFESLLLGNRALLHMTNGTETFNQSIYGSKIIQAAKSGGLQGFVLLFKIVTIWDCKMAISSSCLTFCVYTYLYVHTQYPLNFSPLPGRIIALSLHLYIHLLEPVMSSAWESWLSSTQKTDPFSEMWTFTVKCF